MVLFRIRKQSIGTSMAMDEGMNGDGGDEEGVGGGEGE